MITHAYAINQIIKCQAYYTSLMPRKIISQIGIHEIGMYLTNEYEMKC